MTYFYTKGAAASHSETAALPVLNGVSFRDQSARLAAISRPQSMPEVRPQLLFTPP